MEFVEVEKVLDSYSKYVIQQAKSNLTKSGKGDGALYNSLKFEVIQDNTAMLVEFFMEDYGIFVDEGVKGANPSLVDSQKTGRVVVNLKKEVIEVWVFGCRKVFLHKV